MTLIATFVVEADDLDSQKFRSDNYTLPFRLTVADFLEGVPVKSVNVTSVRDLSSSRRLEGRRLSGDGVEVDVMILATLSAVFDDEDKDMDDLVNYIEKELTDASKVNGDGDGAQSYFIEKLVEEARDVGSDTSVLEGARLQGGPQYSVESDNTKTPTSQPTSDPTRSVRACGEGEYSTNSDVPAEGKCKACPWPTWTTNDDHYDEKDKCNNFFLNIPAEG